LGSNHYKKRAARYALGGGILLGFVFWLKVKPSPVLKIQQTRKEQTLDRKLLKLFRNRGSAEVIGREYLKDSPEEKKGLAKKIYGSLGFSSPYTQISLKDLRKKLKICRQNDFKYGRVVELERWLLSITEARLCAFVFQQSREYRTKQTRQ